jgi:hypothetical protein
MLPNAKKYSTDPEGLYNAWERVPGWPNPAKTAKLKTTCETNCNKKGKACQPCPLEKCLLDCYNDPAHVCAAVTVSRTGSGCKFYSAICSGASATRDATMDTYFKRWDYGPADVDRALKSNLTTLSFAPVALTHSRGAALKVCFCDSVLHPTCSTPADFDVELGRLHISGAMCQATRPLASTHECRHQEYSGLACVPKPPVPESGRLIEMVAPATLTLEMSTTFVLSESDLILLQSFPAARAFAILNGLAKGLGVSVGAIAILSTTPGGWGGDLASLTVDYSVTGGVAVASTVGSFAEGEEALVASVTAAIEAALASQSLDGLMIVSVNSSTPAGDVIIPGNVTNISRS